MELTITRPFRLADTLACGQGHHWLSRDYGWHEGVVGADLVRVRQTGTGIEFTVASDTVLEWSSSPVAIPEELVQSLTPGIANPGQCFIWNT